jgi:hypothetical protein
MAGTFVIAQAVNAAPPAIFRTILCIVLPFCFKPAFAPGVVPKTETLVRPSKFLNCGIYNPNLLVRI